MNTSSEDSSGTKQNSRAWRAMLRYRIMLVFFAPIIIIFTLIQATKANSVRYFIQRIGIVPRFTPDIDVWIHAASVGEVFAAIPLIKTIHANFPNKQLLLTTTTTTGAITIEQQKLANTQHCYLPLDFSVSVSLFLKRINPHCAVILETEIWPNLFRLCHRYQIPVVTVNGRISHRTLHVKPWIKRLYTTTLSYSSLILSRSDNDSKSYIALGANPDKVKTIGNIKFSAEVAVPANSHIDIKRPYILAASTHDNEEFQLAQLWLKRPEQLKQYLLIIAPRHPQRLEKILGQLGPLNLNVAIRSLKQNVTDQTEIYIADTVGELMRFMHSASLIFMGGSLVPIGGHNILEPAWLGKTILFGPYMNNFEDESRLLLDNDAAVQVQDTQQLEKQLLDLTQDAMRRHKLGRNALRLVEAQKDIAQRYLTELQKYI